MKNIAILQPSELGSDFTFNQEAGVWQVNFPAPVESNVLISQDANNLIEAGPDGGGWVDASTLIAHALVQDTEEQKIHLYRYPAGTTFDVTKATIVGSVDMVQMNGVFDDIAIDGNNITFTDAQTNTTLALDIDTLQRVSRIVGSNSIAAATSGNTVTLSAIVNPDSDNLLTVVSDGLVVNTSDVEYYLESLIAAFNNQQTLRLRVSGDEAIKRRTIGGQAIDIPQLAFVGSAGNHLAYCDDITAPIQGYVYVAE